ncbi:putative 11-S seed storage protein, plant [Helianthus annuus]|uniref:11-S seed storage protein, plant n=1 Tax=Helianthus annuus TaxID=4232 RepID=A0A251TVT1_HELAN|nr:11S globulin seed storage protein G3-like [Helianthus annuus]KAF5822035.1 putative 11-S seed storage protein, plant [Helianthus annuus]KAJ0626923.1 putative 11-S seed storage protein, plant [Helianthus annuus]
MHPSLPNMAKLFVSLSFLLLIHGCLAYQPFFQQQNQCQIQRINALEPITRVQSEAGVTEVFDSNEQQFQCAGVEVIRHRIQPRGLLLPSYTNTPILFFVELGSGIQGVMLPGCPETYEVSTEQFEGRKGGSAFTDRHQKIHQFWQGDVVAIPTGAAHWLYNNGQDELVIIALLDSTNYANQLDPSYKRFFLAGNSQGEQVQQIEQPRSWENLQQDRLLKKGSDNIFKGFTTETIAESFNVDHETAELLRGESDQRGHIVFVEKGLQVIQPPMRHEEQEYRGGPRANGVEETICSMKLRVNIDDPSEADLYNPQAGRCTRLNSFKFPILQYLQLSAERGVLHRNAIVSPHWIMNAHNIIYVTDGYMRIQIVNDQGQEVFNDVLQEQQLVVVPQNFAVAKQAGEQGSKWISFRTNDNAIMNTLAGRTSVMRALPVDVLANAYQLSSEDAQKLKYNRQESVLFMPGGSYTGSRGGM